MRLDQIRVRELAAVTAACLLVGMAAVSAAERTFEGDIVAVDGKGNTFTVRATDPREQLEMAFHAGPSSEIVIDGNRVVFGELVKGDHVTVSYEAAGSRHDVRRAERRRTASKEFTFDGTVSSIDLKAQTFSVKNGARGGPAEMLFHFNPTTRLYIGGDEDHLLAQLKPGQVVSVTYDSTDDRTHNIKHVRHTA